MSLAAESSGSEGGRTQRMIDPSNAKSERSKYMMLIAPFQMEVTGCLVSFGTRNTTTPINFSTRKAQMFPHILPAMKIAQNVPVLLPLQLMAFH